MPEAEENLENLKKKLTEDYPDFSNFSSYEKGLRELLFAVADKIEETPEFPLDMMRKKITEFIVFFISMKQNLSL